EVRKLHDQKHSITFASVLKVNEWFRRENISGPLWQIDAEIEPPRTGAKFSLEFFRGTNQGAILECDTKRRIIHLDRTHSGWTDFNPAFIGDYEAPLEPGPVRLRIFIDTSSVEVFVNDGETVLTAQVFPAPSSQVMKLWTSNDALVVRELN